MYCYINFYFENLEYDDTFFEADFYCEDAKAFCHFRYDRRKKEYGITDNTLSAEELLPLPVSWLEFKLRQGIKLEKAEWKVSM